jgi:hypothetical protein
MKMRMALLGGVAAALALGVFFSGCGEAGVEDFDMAGTYTFQVNGSACKLEFRNNGKYYYTGATQGVNKEGVWSASGDEIAMSYIITEANATVKETFAATRDSKGDVTLRLKGGAEISTILSSFSLLAKEMTLTKYTAPVSPPVNIEKEDFIGCYSEYGGVIEFKSDGAVERMGEVTSDSFSGAWELSNGNELTVSINEAWETFIIEEFLENYSNRVSLASKDRSDRSKPSGLGYRLGYDNLYRIQDNNDPNGLNRHLFIGQFTVTTEGAADIDSRLTLDFTGAGYYVYENGVEIYKNSWDCSYNTENMMYMLYGVYDMFDKSNVKTEYFEFVRNGPDFVLTLMDDEAEKSRAFESFGVDAKTLVLTRRATRLGQADN